MTCSKGWSQKDYSPVPGLASSWTHSADGLTWTFKIRSGVTWSDGQPLTADDVAYTFNRAINDEAANAQYYNYVKNIKSVEAPDATTAVFHLTRRGPDHDAAVGADPTGAHLEERVGEGLRHVHQHAMVGSGPFQLVKWDQGPVHRAQGEQERTGVARRRSTTWSTASTRTRTR